MNDDFELAEDQAAPYSTANEPERDDALLPCKPCWLHEIGLKTPPIPFVYGTMLIKGMLSVLGGIGGAGKTSLALKVLLSIAIGRSLLVDDPNHPRHTIFEKRGKVWYYSLEDPIDMLQRKVYAEMLHHDLPYHAVCHHLALSSAREHPLVVAKVLNGAVVRCNIQPIVDHIVAHNIVVMVVDPFANSFEGPDAESSSDVMKIVLDQWRQVAHRANCAIWLIHHFRKGGQAGDADAFRGSSLIQNAARAMETLSTMTVDHAKLLCIPDEERRNYVELQNAKVNLSAPPSSRTWFRFVSVALGNHNDKYPKGDVMGVLTRWTPHQKVLTADQARYVLDRIEQGDPNGMQFSYARQNAEYWAGSLLMSIAGFPEALAAKQIESWLDRGLLTRGEYKHPKHGKITKRAVVNRLLLEGYLAQLAGE